MVCLRWGVQTYITSAECGKTTRGWRICRKDLVVVSCGFLVLALTKMTFFLCCGTLVNDFSFFGFFRRRKHMVVTFELKTRQL